VNLTGRLVLDDDTVLVGYDIVGSHCAPLRSVAY
jgi:hypothetical protein